MSDLIRQSANDIVSPAGTAARSRPLDCLDALEQRIAASISKVNALPTLCFDRARDGTPAKLMRQKPMASRGAAGAFPCPSRI